jgi:hypothetical protein
LTLLEPLKQTDRVKKQKMPRDVNQRAKATLDLITGERQTEPERVKDPRAVELGRAGGIKGGAARAKKLSPERRREIAQKAAAARWKKESGEMS